MINGFNPIKSIFSLNSTLGDKKDNTSPADENWLELFSRIIELMIVLVVLIAEMLTFQSLLLPSDLSTVTSEEVGYHRSLRD